MTGLAALLVALGVLLLGPVRISARLDRFDDHLRDDRVDGARASSGSPGTTDPPALLRRLRPPAAALIVVGGWTILGGWFGLVSGLGGAVVGWRVLGSVESPATVRRREALARDLPMAVHLLGASLKAGSAVGPALSDVAAAMGGPVADELRLVVRRLELGADPASAWSATDAELRPLGRSMARAYQSGASVVLTVDRIAEELRATRRHRTEALARSVEVRAAAPLGLCFLPAFVVLGVVPMVVGIFSTMSLFE